MFEGIALESPNDFADGGQRLLAPSLPSGLALHTAHSLGDRAGAVNFIARAAGRLVCHDYPFFFFFLAVSSR